MKEWQRRPGPTDRWRYRSAGKSAAADLRGRTRRECTAAGADRGSAIAGRLPVRCRLDLPSSQQRRAWGSASAQIRQFIALAAWPIEQLIGLIAVRERFGFRIELEPLIPDAIGYVGQVTEQHRKVADLDVGRWFLPRSDTVNEIVLMLFVCVSAEL